MWNLCWLQSQRSKNTTTPQQDNSILPGHVQHHSNRMLIMFWRHISRSQLQIYRLFGRIRNFSGRFSWIRNPVSSSYSTFQWKHLFDSVFNEFGVCCWNLCFLVKCFSTAYIPGFWARCFQTLFIKMFKVFLWNAIFIAFGGLTPIDWTSKPLLQSFNFRSFFVIFGLKSVWLE